jgi:putative FmdB family regulatory protein
MPIYSYQCQKCAHIEEAWNKSVHTRDECPIPFCKNCGNTEKMLRPGVEKSNFSFKDGGHNGQYNKYGPRKGN